MALNITPPSEDPQLEQPQPHHPLPSPRASAAANILQFIKFGIVGGSGTLVNLAATVVVTKVVWWLFDAVPADAVVNLFGSRFHLRWYFVIATVAFLVANTWNYQLNRMWTFKAANRRSWWAEFFPFLATGIFAFVFSLAVLHALMNTSSPIHLSTSFFDDSSGLKNRFYWAQLISIVVAMPVNFLVNKFWTFRGHSVTVVEHTEPS